MQCLQGKFGAEMRYKVEAPVIVQRSFIISLIATKSLKRRAS